MARANTYADRVNIVKVVKVDGKWISAPVVERKGKIIRDHVLVKGRDEHHPEGCYYLDWYDDGKKRRQTAPPFEELISAARVKFIELRARKAGMLVEIPRPENRLTVQANPTSASSSPPDPNRLTVADAVQQFLGFCEKQRSIRTWRTYRPASTLTFSPRAPERSLTRSTDRTSSNTSAIASITVFPPGR